MYIYILQQIRSICNEKRCLDKKERGYEWKTWALRSASSNWSAFLESKLLYKFTVHATHLALLPCLILLKKTSSSVYYLIYRMKQFSKSFTWIYTSALFFLRNIYVKIWQANTTSSNLHKTFSSLWVLARRNKNPTWWWVRSTKEMNFHRLKNCTDAFHWMRENL